MGETNFYYLIGYVVLLIVSLAFMYCASKVSEDKENEHE